MVGEIQGIRSEIPIAVRFKDMVTAVSEVHIFTVFGSHPRS
jgi:hypothetical protein